MLEFENNNKKPKDEGDREAGGQEDGDEGCRQQKVMFLIISLKNIICLNAQHVLSCNSFKIIVLFLSFSSVFLFLAYNHILIPLKN